MYLCNRAYTTKLEINEVHNMDNKNKTNLIWCVKLTRMQLTVVHVEATDRCEKFFYKKETAEKWLTDHGFVFGKFQLFKDTPEAYWFHQRDCINDYFL